MASQLLLFDVDGVLFDSMDFWHNCGSMLLRQLNVAPDEDFNAKVCSLSIQQTAEIVCRDYHVPLTPREISDRIVQLAHDYYVDEVQLKEGVHETVQYLAATGRYAFAIATAGESELVKAALERVGLRAYFPTILCCREIGYGKDSPELYRCVARHFHAQPQEMTVLEDALYAATSAKNAGCRVIGVYDRPAHSDWPALQALTGECITSMSQLPNILER